LSKFLHHEACEQCGSSDGLAVYEDNKHCFVCGYHEASADYEGEGTISDKHEVRHSIDRDVTPLPGGEQVAIKDRKISSGTVNKYRVTVNTNPESQVGHVYPYFDENGAHVANKVRRKGEKAFYWEGDVGRGTLFGQQLFPAGGKAITVVEGECDALAGFQLTGSRYPCISVKSASEAKKNCADHFEYLNSFEKIVICFDSDEPGQKAAQQVAQLFQPGKVHILKLEKAKDANDYLMQGLEKEYINEWFRAPTYMPDGLKIGKDTWGEIENHVVPKSVPYPWKGLNHTTYGIRLSEVTLITADTGVGKTSIVKEIEHSLLTNPELIEEKAGVGILHLEEPNYDTLIGLMSVNANKPFHLPDTERTNEELREHFDAVINTERVVIWDHFGSNDVDAVLSKIRHMAALGCKYIVLDHLSIVVSDQSGDERKQLDEISTKLKMLCMNLDIAVIAIIHINRQGQVRGSAGPEQISNIVIKLYRDKTDPDPWRRNVTRLTVEKNRFCGRTGPSCWLFYNEITGRLEELGPEAVEAYEKGTSLAGNEFELYAK
jgi:twinkle protein